jgi:adenylosuccinate lyase
METTKTQPKPRFPKDYKADPSMLAGGRYGTKEMCEIWGPEKTFAYSLRVQGQSAVTMSRLHPDIVPRTLAEEINEKASLKYINPNRIRELEDKTGHDVIAINTAIEEVLSPEAKAHVNKAKTSADTTQSARALQLKDSMNVLTDSTENLRDVVLEKSLVWAEEPYMTSTHKLDSLPGVAGRPMAHYGEMLQSDLYFMKFVHDNSIKGKWADATGDHHSAKTLGIDGIELQEEYCKDLGIGYMIAPAQIPGLEFEADIFFSMGRTGETLNNLSNFITDGYGDDTNIFTDTNPRKRKGSSAMPHKDIKGGNRTTEEQNMSIRNYTQGLVTTGLANCQMPYARNLAASANSRLNFDNGFKFLDHGVRNLSNAIYWTEMNKEANRKRVERSFGVITSEQVMTYLTDSRKVANPLPRSEAHELVAQLATKAYTTRTPFHEVLLQDERVTSRLDGKTIKEITDPFAYLGESEKIVKMVYDKFHGKKTL